MSSKKASKNDLAHRLRAAREQAGLSQGQAAKLLGMHRPSLTNVESGQRRVSADELPRFAELYRVSVDWLLDQTSPEADPAVELAARELARLDPEDLASLMRLIKTLKRGGDERG